MAISTYGDIGNRTAAHAAETMLAHAEPVLILSKFGLTKPAPRNATDTVKFRRPIPFPAVTTPLAEGITPTPGSFGYEEVTVQMLQWGDIYSITDKVADMSEDPVLNDMSMLAGEQAAATIEQVIYGKIKAGTTVFYANGASRAAVNTAISLDDQRKVVRYLSAMKAKRFTRILASGTNYGSRSVEAAWIAVCHTDLEADIRDLPGFKTVADYGSRQPLVPEELGSVENVRYIASPDLAPWLSVGGTPGSDVVSTNGTAADVYPIIYLGMEAYGLVPLKGATAIRPTVINPGTIDKSDPLGQLGYVGWKAYFNAVILNQTWMARLEVGASAL